MAVLGLFPLMLPRHERAAALVMVVASRFAHGQTIHGLAEERVDWWIHTRSATAAIGPGKAFGASRPKRGSIL